jgi:hypothetical protein
MSDYIIKNGKSTFTLGNGITVVIKPIAPFLLNDARKKIAKPKPPVQKIPTYDGTGFIEESNPAHPDYQAALQNYHEELGLFMGEVMMRLGVEAEVDHDAVKQLREQWAKLNIGELDSDDAYCYIRYCLIETQEDFQNLIEAVTSRNNPTEKAVADAIETFQPEIQG